MPGSWSGVHGDDPRPMCHREESLVFGGRLIRLTKQLVCDDVSSVPGEVRLALRRRRTDMDGVGNEAHEKFNGLSLFFILRFCTGTVVPSVSF